MVKRRFKFGNISLIFAHRTDRLTIIVSNFLISSYMSRAFMSPEAKIHLGSSRNRYLWLVQSMQRMFISHC